MDKIREQAKDIYRKKIKNKERDRRPKEEIIKELYIENIELGLKVKRLKSEKRELIKERDKCNELFKFSPMTYVTLDNYYKIKECNFKATQLFGMPEQDILGTPFTIFLDKEDQKYFNKIIKGRESKEVRMKTKLKDIKKQKIDVIIDITKIPDEKIFIVITDITSVKSLSDRYNMVMQESSDYIIITDVNGEIEDYNKKADDLFDISLRKNNNIYEIIDRDKFKENLKEVDVSTKKVIKYFKRKDDKSIYLNWIYKKLGSGENSIIQHIFHDVTNLIENVKRLEDINRQKNNFIETITHDLKNPLNAIIGFSEILKEEDLSDETLEEVELILKSGQTLKSLINGILELSKVSNQKIKIKKERYNLYEEIKYIIDVLRVTAEKKNLLLKLDYRCDIEKEYNFDKQRLFQILSNIIGNSIKFTNEGRVDVVVKKVNDSKKYDKLEIIISDTGIGIESVDIGNVFSKFTRGRNVEDINGTGIGLSVVKKIIEILGGGITLESELEKGTTVRIVLPFEK